MKVIGITGGVGCGKTTVLSLIEQNYNAFIIKTDEVGHIVMKKDSAGYEKILLIFGEEILDCDGEINRKKLGEIVFSNPNKLMVLNSIIHPLVKKFVMEDMAVKKCEGIYDYYFIESALLFDDHYEVICDETWYIYSDYETRVERLKKSRQYSDEKIKDIISNQLSHEEFVDKCDYMIDNSRDYEQTLSQIKKILVQ